MEVLSFVNLIARNAGPLPYVVKRHYSNAKKVKNVAGERAADLSALRFVARQPIKNR
jgi:hypothetical protein